MQTEMRVLSLKVFLNINENLWSMAASQSYFVATVDTFNPIKLDRG